MKKTIPTWVGMYNTINKFLELIHIRKHDGRHIGTRFITSIYLTVVSIIKAFIGHRFPILCVVSVLSDQIIDRSIDKPCNKEFRHIVMAVSAITTILVLTTCNYFTARGIYMYTIAMALLVSKVFMVNTLL